MIERLRRRDLPIDTVALARDLVGKMLVHDPRGRRTSGRIAETKTYPVGDAAGHASLGSLKMGALRIRYEIAQLKTDYEYHRRMPDDVLHLLYTPKRTPGSHRPATISRNYSSL